MRISENGIVFLKKEEEFRSSPYLCSANKATIGYGSTFYKDGTKVTLKDKPITEAEATSLLMHLLEQKFNINILIKVPISQNQFDSLTSFAYNIGYPAFSNSTLLRMLNQKDYKGASEQFARWKYADGKESKGLINRRAREKALFLRA